MSREGVVTAGKPAQSCLFVAGSRQLASSTKRPFEPLFHPYLLTDVQLRPVSLVHTDGGDTACRLSGSSREIVTCKFEQTGSEGSR